MAIQRQNPQFDPQRIVQPTATPIDTYFRPMLRQPEQPKILQVAAALSDISPQLGRLASDAMAANIAAQKEYGQYDASTEKDPEVLRRKATEAIEGAGGIAPWRYQAFLEAYGQRLVRDHYRNELYNHLDDLSNPYNEDGTVRSPNYVAEQMTKLYEKAGIPTDSYFIQKGAAAARAEADNSFYDRLMGARRQKVMDASRDTLADGIQFAIDTNPDMSVLFGKSGAIKVLSDRYYQNGGQDGDDIVATGVLNAAKGLAAEGNYDRALELLRFPIEEKIGDRTMGARHRARLQETYDIIERKGREVELQDGRDRESRKQIASLAVEDKLIAELQGMKQNTRFLSLNMTDVMELVDKNMAGVNMDEDIKVGVRGRMVDWARNYVDALNKPEQRDPRQENISFDQASRNAQTMEPGEYRDHVSGLLANELITIPQYTQLVAQNKAYYSLSDGDRQQMNLRLSGIMGTAWTGLNESQIARDATAELSSIGNRAASDLMSKFFAEVNAPEFKQKYPDDAQRAAASDQVMARLVGETRASLLSQHRDVVDRSNLAASFDATVGREFEQESANYIPLVLTELGLGEDLNSSRLSSRLSSILYDRFRDEWSQINSEPGQPAMSLEQRKRAIYRRVNDVKDQLLRDVTEKPDSLGLPNDLLNVLKASGSLKSEQVGEAAIAEVRGKIASAADVSKFIVTSAPSTSTIRGKQGLFAGGNPFVNRPVSPSEEALFDYAKNASVAYQRVLAAKQAGAEITPKMAEDHNRAKMLMEAGATSYISDFSNMSIGTARNRPDSPWIPSGYYNGRYRSIPSNQEAPLFLLREGGVFVAMQDYSPITSVYSGDVIENGILYAPAPSLNNRYWAAKAIIGYSPEEVAAGRTTEGVRITPEQMNGSEFLFFRSPEEFTKALEEYNSTEGKRGYIAEQVLPKTKMPFDAFRAAQFQLLGIRKPLAAAAQPPKE